MIFCLFRADLLSNAFALPVKQCFRTVKLNFEQHERATMVLVNGMLSGAATSLASEFPG